MPIKPSTSITTAATTDTMILAGYQVFNSYIFCENTYPLHTQFAPKNIPFTYLWAPKIHTFLSIKYIGASFLAQPNEYAAVKENRMSKPIRLGEGVQFLRGKILCLGIQRDSEQVWLFK